MARISHVGSFTLLCAACLTIMVGCVIVPGLPQVADHLGTPDASSWLVTVPSLGVVVFGPFVGTLIERSRKGALVLGLALYGGLGIACIWLEGYTAVFLDRFLLGGATALVMAAGTTIISDVFDGKARLKMIARQGMAIEIGGVIFLALGGVLATAGWDKPFYLYLIAWLLIPFVIGLIPSVSIDGKSSFATKHADDPGVAGLTDIYAAAVLSMIAFFAGVILLPAKLLAIGINEAGTGYFLSFVSLVAVGAAYAMPKVISRLGSRTTLSVAFAFYAAAHAVFFVAVSIAPLVAGGVFLGAGFGLSVPLINHETINRSTPAQRGRLLGLLSSAIFLGQFLSAFIELVPGSIDAPFAGAVAISTISLLVVRALGRDNQG